MSLLKEKTVRLEAKMEDFKGAMHHWAERSADMVDGFLRRIRLGEVSMSLAWPHTSQLD